MNESRSDGDPALTARMIHAAIIAGVVLMYAVLMYLTGTVTPPEGSIRHLFRIGGYASIALAYIVGKVLRDRIASTSGGIPTAEWWRANMGKAIALWAVLESAGLFPIVLGYIAADRMLATVGAAVALILLYVTRPPSLATGRA